MKIKYKVLKHGNEYSCSTLMESTNFKCPECNINHTFLLMFSTNPTLDFRCLKCNCMFTIKILE